MWLFISSEILTATAFIFVFVERTRNSIRTSNVKYSEIIHLKKDLKYQIN